MQKYPVSVIAKLLNLSERRVQQLSKDNIIPKTDKGKYDLVACVRGYVQYLYDRAYGQNNDSIDSHIEKARLLKAQADKAEIELDIIRNKYISCDEVEYLWSGLIIAFRTKILGLPTKLASNLATIMEPTKVETILQEEVYTALQALSKYKYEDIYANTEKSFAEDSPATKVKSESVGGSV